MFKVSLKNTKSFICDTNTTLFEAAKAADIFIEHSCLKARCRSCIVKIIEGTTKDKLDDLVLSSEEKSNNLILSCNAIPTSDLYLDVNDFKSVKPYDKKIYPSKIHYINKLNDDIVKISLRLPPNSNFIYNSGQYVNIIKGNLSRSYSISNAYIKDTNLEFFIKKQENGLMSQYWFNDAQPNDLLRIEGPLGSFFLRESTSKNIIFLATGTGFAPIKAMLEQIFKEKNKYVKKTFWCFFGAQYKEDIVWTPNDLDMNNLKFIKVLSKESREFEGCKGYVQDAVLNNKIDLIDAQVYACGSINMIISAKKALLKKSLKEYNFFSDAFVETN